MLCVYHEKCPMFGNQICTDYPTLSEKLKDQYCRGNPELCARKRVREAINKEAVPQLMLPQQYDWAQQLLTEHGISISKIRELLPSCRKAKIRC
jgi:hypothetical protein